MKADILIIDDMQEELYLMKTVCRMVDPTIEIATSSSGTSAIESMKNRRHELPKVILLDLRMPGKSGQEVLLELKADSNLNRIPVCIFSSANISSEVCECYQKGAAFYFKKPSGLSELKKFVENFKDIWFKYATLCPN